MTRTKGRTFEEAFGVTRRRTKPAKKKPAKKRAAAAAKKRKRPSCTAQLRAARAKLRARVRSRSAPAVATRDVVRSMRRLGTRSIGGLVFVPKLARALGPRGTDAIERAARAGAIELRPESGLGRLSAADLALCPAGPQGTRLSWARLVDGGGR